MRAVDLGQLSKVLVEHHNVGYGAGWYLDQIVIHESGKTDEQYVFLCQQWLDSGVGDAQMERTLKLLGKVRNGMLTGKIYGKVQNPQSSFQFFLFFFLIVTHNIFLVIFKAKTKLQKQ